MVESDIMDLTSEQQLEMFADIKVIKSNCLNCKNTQTNHENRIAMLEKRYWKFTGICTAIAVIIPFIIDYLLK